MVTQKEAGDFILLDLNFEIFQKREVYKTLFNKDINVGDYAIVETARGIEAAKINSFQKHPSSLKIFVRVLI